MKARLVKFGEIEVEGERYTHDVVIDGGKVRKRKKGPSKQFHLAAWLRPDLDLREPEVSGCEAYLRAQG
jgi:hypothetical protein